MIVEKVNGARIADLDRKKYLVPGDLTGSKVLNKLICDLFSPNTLLTVAQFMHVLRQRIQLGATESIFLMVGGVAPTTGYV